MACLFGASSNGEGALIEYHPGRARIIITVPHGGSLEPGDVPNRVSGNKDLEGNCVVEKEGDDEATTNTEEEEEPDKSGGEEENDWTADYCQETPNKIESEIVNNEDRSDEDEASSKEEDEEEEEGVKPQDISCGDIVNSFGKITTVTDSYTIELAHMIADRLEELLFGQRPHIIICNMRRTKLDPNREIGEGAQGNPTAVGAYNAYHGYVERAKNAISRSNLGTGILLDLHGQGHMQNSTELGYLLSSETMNEEVYDTFCSSVRNLAEREGITGKELITGKHSLGARLENEGFNAVPSPRQPAPGEDKYFSGGYTTRVHGSVGGRGCHVDAIQVECPKEVRIDGGEELRKKFGRAMGTAIARFFIDFYC